MDPLSNGSAGWRGKEIHPTIEEQEALTVPLPSLATRTTAESRSLLPCFYTAVQQQAACHNEAILLRQLYSRPAR